MQGFVSRGSCRTTGRGQNTSFWFTCIVLLPAVPFGWSAFVGQAPAASNSTSLWGPLCRISYGGTSHGWLSLAEFPKDKFLVSLHQDSQFTSLCLPLSQRSVPCLLVPAQISHLPVSTQTSCVWTSSDPEPPSDLLCPMNFSNKA